MKNNFLLILTFLSCTTIFSQNDETIIYGKIVTDSLSPESIHVVNKSLRKATISNSQGEFEIPIRVNDTLLFSAIQFQYKEHIISTEEIKKQKLIIRLKVQINELDEVELKQHDLTGYLKNDIKNASLENHVDAYTLNIPVTGKKPVTEVDFVNRDINFYSKGGNITKLYGWISGEKKKLKKFKKLATEKMVLDNIRKLITDDYFEQTLLIKKEDIPAFIEHCKTKGIIQLYKENKKMKVIDVLINESKIYRK